MTRQGVDIYSIPLWRVCNVVLSYLLEGRDETERQKFFSRLHRPPKGVKTDYGVWATSSQASSFDDAASALESFEQSTSN